MTFYGPTVFFTRNKYANHLTPSFLNNSELVEPARLATASSNTATPDLIDQIEFIRHTVAAGSTSPASFPISFLPLDADNPSNRHYSQRESSDSK